MSKKSSKSVKPTQPANQIVYEVRTANKELVVVTADTARYLAEQLESLLSLEPYAIQALARLVSMERAKVETATWSVRRVGVMRYEADPVPGTSQTGAERSARRREVEVPTASVSGQADPMTDRDPTTPVATNSATSTPASQAAMVPAIVATGQDEPAVHLTATPGSSPSGQAGDAAATDRDRAPVADSAGAFLAGAQQVMDGLVLPALGPDPSESTA